MMGDSRSYFSRAVSYAQNIFYKIKQWHQCCQTYFSLSLEINQLQLEQGNLTEVEGFVQLTSLYKLVQISSFLIEIIIQLCYKISYLILDVNCTELSSSVNVPWLESLAELSASVDKHSSLFCQSKDDKENSFCQTFFLCHLYIRHQLNYSSLVKHPASRLQLFIKSVKNKNKSFLSNIFLCHLLIELISQCIDQRDCS